MAELLLTVAGRSYRLACRDGDEPSLRQAAQSVDVRATQLAAQLGAVGESRLLLMTALSLAGDDDGRGESRQGAEPDMQWLHLVAERLEQVASHLEQAAGAH